MITLTDLAGKKLHASVQDRKLRVLVKTTGCSGLAYHLGISIVVDAKSLAYVDGCEIDYKYEGLNEGFEFYNPKEKARCGCGESFTI